MQRLLLAELKHVIITVITLKTAVDYVECLGENSYRA
jgi:hypothetical protein